MVGKSNGAQQLDDDREGVRAMDAVRSYNRRERAVQMWTSDGKDDNIKKIYNRCSDEYSSARWASRTNSRFLQKNIIRSARITER
ncbi:hypothetical protein PSE10B_14170 [Pseudomonas amygdali pv. eriobotryae]|nr:hypothetical protein PSE10B_14170 [Pseudomonas amygdali pv. eriobotryae]